MIQNAKVGALDFNDVTKDIVVPELSTPDLSALSFSKGNKDLFSEKRKAWKEIDVAEARCDFSENRYALVHRGIFFIAKWKKSVYGRTLREIKDDDAMIAFFADNIANLIADILGKNLNPDIFAVVTTPKRRHLTHNFASLTAEIIAERLNLIFYEDCAFAKNRSRVNAVFIPNNIPPQPNIIVFDDFVTTGSTMIAMHNLLTQLGKNVTCFAAINNHF